MIAWLKQATVEVIHLPVFLDAVLSTPLGPYPACLSIRLDLTGALTM